MGASTSTIAITIIAKCSNGIYSPLSFPSGCFHSAELGSNCRHTLLKTCSLFLKTCWTSRPALCLPPTRASKKACCNKVHWHFHASSALQRHYPPAPDIFYLFKEILCIAGQILPLSRSPNGKEQESQKRCQSFFE